VVFTRRATGRVRAFRGATGVLALAAITAACGSGLSSAEWLWCKQNLAAVDTAAGSIGLPTSQITYREPTWLPAYVDMDVSFNHAALMGSADFIASCDKAADANGVAEGRLAWCQEDGFDEAWTAASDLGLMTEQTGETYSYKVIPFKDRLTNPDFMAACRAAYAGRTS
jgi:hypothetical protein